MTTRLRQRVATALMVLAAMCPSAPAAAQVSWETNLGKARQAARSTNRAMLLEFWSVTCEPCKVLDEKVFPDERIGTAIRKVHTVRIDVDKQPDVAREYGVNGTPTLLLTDAYGTELFRYTGLLEADRMLQLLDELPADVSRFNDLSAALKRDADDFASLATLARALRAESFFRSSNRYAARALQTRETPGQKDARADLLIAMGRNHFELKEYDQSAKAFGRHLKEYPARTSEPEVMLGLGWALLAQDKTSEARGVLQALTAKYKNSRATADAAKLLKEKL